MKLARFGFIPKKKIFDHYFIIQLVTTYFISKFIVSIIIKYLWAIGKIINILFTKRKFTKIQQLNSISQIGFLIYVYSAIFKCKFDVTQTKKT